MIPNHNVHPNATMLKGEGQYNKGITFNLTLSCLLTATGGNGLVGNGLIVLYESHFITKAKVLRNPLIHILEDKGWLVRS